MKKIPNNLGPKFALLFVGGLVLGGLIVLLIGVSFMAKSEPTVPVPIKPLPPVPTNPPTPPSIQKATTTLDVSWYAGGKADMQLVFGRLTKGTPEVRAALSDLTNNRADRADFSLWDKAVVNAGPWKGAKILYFEVPLNGMCGEHCVTSIQLLLSADKKELYPLTDVEAYEYREIAPLLSTTTTKFAMPRFSVPDKIHLKTATLLQPEWALSQSSGNGWDIYPECNNDECPSMTKIGKTEEGYTLYSKSGNCLMIITPDSRAYSYDNPKVGMIEWSSAYAAATKYNYDSFARTGGCGGGSCADIVSASEVGVVSDLIQAGKNASGDPIYIPKNPTQHKQFKLAYESWATYDAQEKPSLEEFAKTNQTAIFFWKDGLGRWMVYHRQDLQPLAECGKPVIYLYPEKTESVHVKLPSSIKVTVSEPTYPRAGWKVMAEPDGTLTLDGQKYGSLFWEGTGVEYARPTEGFVVKDGEVDAFLKTTLAKYGLNEKESAEFREFWVPKMTGAPYYRASFLTSVWSKAAPLSVIPRPQTQIRLFMDWQKLSAPISLPEPKIQTPERVGFTLVEWGGLLMK